MWDEILKFSIGSVTLGGVIIFIAKGIFNAFLNKDIENFKIKLNKELEDHKSELQKINFEHQTKFTKLYEERATVVKETYKMLVDVEDYIKIYFSNILDEKEDTKITGRLFSSLSKFMDYTNSNRILLDEKVYFYLKELEAIFAIIINSYEREYDDGSDFKKSEEWNGIVKRMVDEEIPEFKKELEDQFKKILEF